jgi:hypothetical protein
MLFVLVALASALVVSLEKQWARIAVRAAPAAGSQPSGC